MGANAIATGAVTVDGCEIPWSREGAAGTWSWDAERMALRIHLKQVDLVRGATVRVTGLTAAPAGLAGVIRRLHQIMEWTKANSPVHALHAEERLPAGFVPITRADGAAADDHVPVGQRRRYDGAVVLVLTQAQGDPLADRQGALAAQRNALLDRSARGADTGTGGRRWRLSCGSAASRPGGADSSARR